MSLALAALRALLQMNVEIGLALRGREVKVDGYARQKVPADRWAVRKSAATTQVTFGPVQEALEYDAGVLFVNGEPERELPNEQHSIARLPPRASLIYEAVITARED